MTVTATDLQDTAGQAWEYSANRNGDDDTLMWGAISGELNLLARYIQPDGSVVVPADVVSSMLTSTQEALSLYPICPECGRGGDEDEQECPSCGQEYPEKDDE